MRVNHKNIYRSIGAALIIGAASLPAYAHQDVEMIHPKGLVTDSASIDTVAPSSILTLPPAPFNHKQIDEIIAYARQYTGTPYRRGAKGPHRFDCSGFMQYVFGHFDYSLNARSASQYLQGISVNEHEIRRGDLVFFTGRNARQNRVGHVGLVTEVYADGNFKFIHASTSHGIREDWNTAPYYSQRYIGARRIYPSQIDVHTILDAIIEWEEIDDSPFAGE